MGRRGISVEDDARWVFNRLAQDYRARPGYPGELVDLLYELAGGSAATVVDLGAGTGHVAIPLAARGVRVVAVEPAREMVAVLRERGGDRVQVVHAAAESTGLPADSADLAVLADALQWIDVALAGREIRRVVRPGGRVAVVEASFAATPFMHAIAELIAAANFKARPGTGHARREQLLGAAGVTAAKAQRFRAADALGGERLAAVLRSLSLVGPALGSAAVERLVSEAQELASRDAAALWERDLTVTWGRTR